MTTSGSESVSAWDAQGGNLIFMICPARSGSTMLQMMLASHSRVHSLAEPNVLPPLKFLGYYGSFRGETSYEPVNQSLGFREFVNRLPGAEETYLSACRAYANTLYRSAMQGHEACRYFLDKTPVNALEWELVCRLYPRAKYVVLARHPYAVINSHAESFFMNDFERLLQEKTDLPAQLAAVAGFVRSAPVPKKIVKFEDLVRDPEKIMRDLLDFLGLAFEPSVVEYRHSGDIKGSLGDPITSFKESRPRESYAEKWIQAFASNPDAVRCAEQMLAGLSDEDLADYGYPHPLLAEPLTPSDPALKIPRPKKNPFRFYHFKRLVFFTLRAWARQRWFRKLLEAIHYYCDVLLR